MNRKILILIIIILVILVSVTALIFLVIKKQQIANLNIITEKPKTQQEIARILADKNLYYNEIFKNQKFSNNLYRSVLNFLSFCQYKEENLTLSAQCDNVYNKYFDSLPNLGGLDCVRNVGILGALNFIKSDSKDKFLGACQDYVNHVKANPHLRDLKWQWKLADYEKYYDCNVLWENKFFADTDYCDPDESHCYPILSSDGEKNCTNIINFKDVNPDNLKSVVCKEIFTLRKAASKEDCMKIEDTLTRLICLSNYDNEVCNDIKTNIDKLNLPDFVSKYQLKECCYY
ncbi:MAG: hypothetical protein NTX00_02405 [Candidatus Parcubacteria bacterium]|nr:hypothetical protein [Candidatus Parcubacteria bacterium]